MQSKQKLLIDVLYAAEKNEYSGYSKFDALNSDFLKAITFNNKWLRLLYTQAVKEMPFNIRPLLRVKKSKNPNVTLSHIRYLHVECLVLILGGLLIIVLSLLLLAFS